MELPQRRRLPVNLVDLTEAFDTALADLTTYLDLETGALVSVTSDIQREPDEIWAELAANAPHGVVSFAEIPRAVGQLDLPDWIREAVVVAAEVEHGHGTRFIEVPEPDPREGYEDMEAFIGTVPSEVVRERLSDAIRGRGAFRRFKDVLVEYPSEQVRWFVFKDARMLGDPTPSRPPYENNSADRKFTRTVVRRCGFSC